MTEMLGSKSIQIIEGWNIEKTAILDCVNKCGTPLLIASKEQISKNYKRLKGCLPQVEIFYAVKANHHPKIIRILQELGSNLDISSLGELELALSSGFEPNQLLYTRPIKDEAELRKLKEYGIKPLIFDNENELKKISVHYPHCELVLRIKIENPYCLINLSEKFGCELEEIIYLINKAKELGLKPAGLAFHVGSQTTDPFPFINILPKIKPIINELLVLGFDIALLDIGGGFPLFLEGSSVNIETFCQPIKHVLDNFFQNFRIISEPGRFIIGNACFLVTKVIGKSDRKGIRWYYIDDGLYGCFSGKIYDQADYPIFTLKKNESKGHLCTIAGPTCDSFDVIFKNKLLPELNEGDYLICPYMGSYTYSSATEFNLLKKAELVIIEEEKHESRL
jgi:ornithine decarboxylase